jgi:hypothetical protein
MKHIGMGIGTIGLCVPCAYYVAQDNPIIFGVVVLIGMIFIWDNA